MTMFQHTFSRHWTEGVLGGYSNSASPSNKTHANLNRLQRYWCAQVDCERVIKLWERNFGGRAVISYTNAPSGDGGFLLGACPLSGNREQDNEAVRKRRDWF